MHTLALEIIRARHLVAEEYAVYREAAEQVHHLRLDPCAPAVDCELAELLAAAAHRAWLIAEAECQALTPCPRTPCLLRRVA